MRAFVAMPFNPLFYPVWKAIRHACETNGITPCRVDELPQVEDIHKTIFAEIQKSDIVIADFSGDKVVSIPNPNVVSEAMYARTLQKPIVLLTQSIEALPFDWRTHRALLYNNDDKGVQYLQEVLTENLLGIKKRQAPQGFTFIEEVTHTCGTISNSVKEYQHDKTKMEFVLIPAGSFMMGSPMDEEGRYENENQYKVNLSSYMLAKYPCTQEQWEKVMGGNPSLFHGANRPVEQVSWEDCQKFCDKTGLKLPTEAQWEYACRSGNAGAYCYGNGVSLLKDYAWYYDNADKETHPVGQKKNNAFGLYDIHGNVWQWCQDWHGDYPASEQTNPTGPSTGMHKVYRGGGWNANNRRCRCANRGGSSSDYRVGYVGLRLAANIT